MFQYQQISIGSAKLVMNPQSSLLQRFPKTSLSNYLPPPLLLAQVDLITRNRILESSYWPARIIDSLIREDKYLLGISSMPSFSHTKEKLALFVPPLRYISNHRIATVHPRTCTSYSPTPAPLPKYTKSHSPTLDPPPCSLLNNSFASGLQDRSLPFHFLSSV